MNLTSRVCEAAFGFCFKRQSAPIVVIGNNKGVTLFAGEIEGLCIKRNSNAATRLNMPILLRHIAFIVPVFAAQIEVFVHGACHV